MTLKQVVTRLQQWAFGEGNLRDTWGKLPEGAQSLFPLLRGSADLLMMPKELLEDKVIRGEVRGGGGLAERSAALCSSALSPASGCGCGCGGGRLVRVDGLAWQPHSAGAHTWSRC